MAVESVEDITIGRPTGHMIAIMQERLHRFMPGSYMGSSDHSGIGLKEPAFEIEIIILRKGRNMNHFTKMTEAEARALNGGGFMGALKLILKLLRKPAFII